MCAGLVITACTVAEAQRWREWTAAPRQEAAWVVAEANVEVERMILGEGEV